MSATKNELPIEKTVEFEGKEIVLHIVHRSDGPLINVRLRGVEKGKYLYIFCGTNKMGIHRKY